MNACVNPTRHAGNPARQPLLKAARARVQRAQTAVNFERSLRIPDLQARGGLRYNRELLERGECPLLGKDLPTSAFKFPIQWESGKHSCSEERGFIRRAGGTAS